jgi:prevent-host-death family protein
MRFSTQIKPISYVKTHAAELLDRINEEREPIIITQHGEARAVLMDVASYDDMMQETQVLLKILAHADKEIEAGDTVPIEDVMREFGVGRPNPDGIQRPVYDSRSAGSPRSPQIYRGQ